MPNAVILIPAHNEADSITGVIKEIHQHSKLPVVLIDDASTDDTRSVAQQAGAEVLPLMARLGAWGAIQTGIRYAFHQGYDFAVTMDADGQHEAEYLDKLLTPVTRKQADVSIGACPMRGSPLRKLAWMVLKRLSGLNMEDITSGFRVYNRRAMLLLKHRRATLLEYQDIGVLTLLCHQNLRLAEVPVNMRLRRSGYSKVYNSWLMVSYYMAYSLILGVSKRCQLTTTTGEMSTEMRNKS